jgi:hypothetical protein
MKGNKRSHISSSKASPSVKINPKKKDIKETPKKSHPTENTKKMNEIVTFGTDTWCGSREKCKNSNLAATEELKCDECNYNTHYECLHPGSTYCLWCKELITLQKELQDTSIIPMENNGDDSFDSDATCKVNKPKSSNGIDPDDGSQLIDSNIYE